MRKICPRCSHPVSVSYVVPRDVWDEVFPDDQADDGSTCLSCFARLADERLIQWDADITLEPVSLVTAIERQETDAEDNGSLY